MIRNGLWFKKIKQGRDKVKGGEFEWSSPQ